MRSGLNRSDMGEGEIDCKEIKGVLVSIIH